MLSQYVKPVAFGLIAILIGLEISCWIGFALNPETRRHTDFPMYYFAGQTLGAGAAGNLYRPHLDVPFAQTHLAFEALLFVPLTLLPLWPAYLVWILVNAALLFAVHRLIDSKELRWFSPFGALGALLAFFPISFAVMNGQDSVLLLALAAFSFRTLRQNPFWSGVIIGCAVFRFQFLLPFLAAFLVWKMYRLLAGAALSALALELLSVAMTGWKQRVTYFHLVRDIGLRPPLSETMSNLRGLVTNLHLAPLVLPLSFAIFALVIYRARKFSPEKKFLLAVVVTCLVN